MNPFVAEIRIFPFNFAADGLGGVQRPAHADHPEHGTFLAHRHDVRGRREDHIRPPQPPGDGPPPSGTIDVGNRFYSGPDGGRADRVFEPVPDAGPLAHGQWQ